MADVEEPQTLARPRVLLVDDDDVVIAVIARIIRSLGYDVTECTDANDALERFRREPSAVDILVTDFKMPSLSGIELAARILEIRDEFPILLCTGYADGFENFDCSQFGLRAVVLKPVTAEMLDTAIREALGR